MCALALSAQAAHPPRSAWAQSPVPEHALPAATGRLGRDSPAPRVLGPDAAPVAEALANTLARVLGARVVDVFVEPRRVRVSLQGGGWDGDAVLVDRSGPASPPGGETGAPPIATRHGLLTLPGRRRPPPALQAALDAVSPPLPWGPRAPGGAHRSDRPPRPTGSAQDDAASKEVAPRVASILARRGLRQPRSSAPSPRAPPASRALVEAARAQGGVCDARCVARVACRRLGGAGLACPLLEEGPVALVQAFTSLVALFPLDPKAWVLRGRAWAAAGRPDEALADLAVATSLDVRDADALEHWRAWAHGRVVVPPDATAAALGEPPPLPPAPAGTRAPREGILTPPAGLLEVETPGCSLAPPRLTRWGWGFWGLCARQPARIWVTPAEPGGACSAPDSPDAGRLVERTGAHCVRAWPTQGPGREGAAKAAAAVARAVRSAEPDGFYAPRLPRHARRGGTRAGQGARAARGAFAWRLMVGALALGLAAALLALWRRRRGAREGGGLRGRRGA